MTSAATAERWQDYLDKNYDCFVFRTELTDIHLGKLKSLKLITQYEYHKISNYGINWTARGKDFFELVRHADRFATEEALVKLVQVFGHHEYIHPELVKVFNDYLVTLFEEHEVESTKRNSTDEPPVVASEHQPAEKNVEEARKNDDPCTEPIQEILVSPSKILEALEEAAEPVLGSPEIDFDFCIAGDKNISYPINYRHERHVGWTADTGYYAFCADPIIQSFFETATTPSPQHEEVYRTYIYQFQGPQKFNQASQPASPPPMPTKLWNKPPPPPLPLRTSSLPVEKHKTIRPQPPPKPSHLKLKKVADVDQDDCLQFCMPISQSETMK